MMTHWLGKRSKILSAMKPGMDERPCFFLQSPNSELKVDRHETTVSTRIQTKGTNWSIFWVLAWEAGKGIPNPRGSGGNPPFFFFFPPLFSRFPVQGNLKMGVGRGDNSHLNLWGKGTSSLIRGAVISRYRANTCCFFFSFFLLVQEVTGSHCPILCGWKTKNESLRETGNTGRNRHKYSQWFLAKGNSMKKRWFFFNKWYWNN